MVSFPETNPSLLPISKWSKGFRTGRLSSKLSGTTIWIHSIPPMPTFPQKRGCHLSCNATHREVIQRLPVEGKQQTTWLGFLLLRAHFYLHHGIRQVVGYPLQCQGIR